MAAAIIAGSMCLDSGESAPGAGGKPAAVRDMTFVERRSFAAAPAFHVPRPLNLRSDMQAPGFVFRSFELAPQPLTVWRIRNALLKYARTAFAAFAADPPHAPIPVQEGWERATWNGSDLAAARRSEGIRVSIIPFKGRQNYAHFLLEGLSRVYLASLWQDTQPDTSLIGDGTFTATTDNFVNLLLPGTAIDYIPGNGVSVVDDLIISNALKHPLHWVDPRLLGFLRGRAWEAAPRTGRFRGRIYIDRAVNRGVENRDEMLALLEHYDFQALQLETMSAAEQIDAFRSAKVIIGEHGAGLSNMIFCSDPAAVSIIEIMPRHFGMQSFWFLAAGLRANYYVIPELGGFHAERDTSRKRALVNVDLAQLDDVLRGVLVDRSQG